MCTWHPVHDTVHPVLVTVHSVQGTVHQVPGTVNQVPGTVHQVLGTVHPVPFQSMHFCTFVNPLKCVESFLARGAWSGIRNRIWLSALCRSTHLILCTVTLYIHLVHY